MAEVKKQDKRIHVMADALRPKVSVKDKAFTFTLDAGQAVVDAANAENGEKKPQLTLEILKAADEFFNDLEPAIVHATGAMGVDAMKADASIETLKGTLTLGTTDFIVNQQRAYSSHNPQFGKNPDAPERIEKSGRPTIKRDMANGGAAYKRAIEAVCEYASDVL